MRVLIDEQLPVKLKYRFTDAAYETYTVKEMGWLGKKNGELLELMVRNQFNILLTNDKSMYFQQKIEDYALTIININTKTNNYEEIMEVMDEIKRTLKKMARNPGHLKYKKGRYKKL